MTDSDATTVIRPLASEVEAGLAQLHLEAMGIASWIAKDDCGGAYPQLQIAGGVRLLVRAADAAQADEILQAAEAEDAPLADSPPPAAGRSRPYGAFSGGFLVGMLITAGIAAWLQHPTNPPTEKIAFDQDADGVKEAVHFFEDGLLVRIHEDRNGDGRIDQWTFLRDDQLSRAQADDNFDGRPDAWTDYVKPYDLQTRYDTDFDGRPDVTYYQRHGVVIRADWHPGDRERIARRVIYQDGVRRLKHVDTDGDGRFDLTIRLDPFEREIGRVAYGAGG
jgi:hypothetical protein